MVSFSYTIKKSKRAHSLRISLNSKGEVVVTKPWFVPQLFADRFVAENEAWVLDKLKKLVKSAPKDTMWYQGNEYRFVFQQGKFSVRIEKQHMIVSAYSPSSAKRSLKTWLQDQAKQMILSSVKQFSIKMGVSYNGIRIKDQSSRWGSCSSQNNLNFNWRLIMAPPQTLSYVVIHELAHLKHMDHSRDFWRMVEQFDPDYRENRRWLKRHQEQLHYL